MISLVCSKNFRNNTSSILHRLEKIKIKKFQTWCSNAEQPLITKFLPKLPQTVPRIVFVDVLGVGGEFFLDETSHRLTELNIYLYFLLEHNSFFYKNTNIFKFISKCMFLFKIFNKKTLNSPQSRPQSGRT